MRDLLISSKETLYPRFGYHNIWGSSILQGNHEVESGTALTQTVGAVSCRQ